jgi:hypothetical protein
MRIVLLNSVYRHLVNNEVVSYTRNLAYKDSSQNKNTYVVFEKEVIFTKDNLARRNWNMSKACSLCHKLFTTSVFLMSVIMRNFFVVRYTFC